MKKILSLVLVLTLVLGMALSLASCSKMLSGTYKADIGVASTSYTFSGSKVEITYEVVGFEKNIEGTYKITTNDDDEQVIIFTFPSDEEDADDYAGEFSFSEGEEDGVKYIKIGGVKYTEQK